MENIGLVLKKEVKEWLHGQDIRTTLFQLVFLVGVFGVLVPLRSTGELGRFLPLVIAFLPVFLVSNFIADSFAGERERGTLETLLATPLPDYAIFVGKVLAGVTYAWGYTLLVLVASLVTSGLVRGVMLAPFTVLTTLVGALLMAVLIGTFGALVSIRARSVRSAQQMLGLPLMALFLGIGFGVPALARILPRTWLVQLAPLLHQVTGRTAIGLTLLLLVLIDGGLLAIALQRFQRSRLILPN